MSSIEVRGKLLDVALGNASPDMVIKGGTLVNVHTRELYMADIIICGERIAAVGAGNYKLDEHCIVIDAAGQFVSPGLIDPHVHIESSAVSVTEFARAVVPRGVTSISEDPHELANVLGIPGLDLFYEEARGLPFNLFLRVPGRLPAMTDDKETSGAKFSLEETFQLLDRPEAVCLAGDINPSLLLTKDPTAFEKIDYAIKIRKTISGQSPGLKDGALNAFIAAGAEDSHVSEDTAEILDIIRHGMRALITHRADMFGVEDYPELARVINDKQIDTRLLHFCTDDIQPHILSREGHLDERLRLGMRAGIDPLTAIQMATINTAEFLRINRDYGSITPGKFADILILDDLAEFKVDRVIHHGRIAARDGSLVIEPPRFEYPRWAKETINVPRKFQAADFQVRTRRTSGEVEVRVIMPRMPKKQTIERLRVENGVVQPDQSRDILGISVIERHRGTGGMSCGFVTNIGLKDGAIASSVSHDAHNILVIGSNPEDMAVAANRLVELRGGHVAIKAGRVVSEIALPIAGLMAEEPLAAVASKFERFETLLADELHCTIDRPLYMLNFICLPNIPHVGITDKGLIDSDTMEILDVVIG